MVKVEAQLASGTPPIEADLRIRLHSVVMSQGTACCFSRCRLALSAGWPPRNVERDAGVYRAQQTPSVGRGQRCGRIEPATMQKTMPPADVRTRVGNSRCRCRGGHGHGHAGGSGADADEGSGRAMGRRVREPFDVRMLSKSCLASLMRKPSNFHIMSHRVYRIVSFRTQEARRRSFVIGAARGVDAGHPPDLRRQQTSRASRPRPLRGGASTPPHPPHDNNDNNNNKKKNNIQITII